MLGSFSSHAIKSFILKAKVRLVTKAPYQITYIGFLDNFYDFLLICKNLNSVKVFFSFIVIIVVFILMLPLYINLLLIIGFYLCGSLFKLKIHIVFIQTITFYYYIFESHLKLCYYFTLMVNMLMFYFYNLFYFFTFIPCYLFHFLFKDPFGYK